MGVKALNRSGKGKITKSFEIELDIEYEYYPPERVTCDYPGSSAEVEILDMKISGYEQKIPDELFDQIVTDHYDEIREECEQDHIENVSEIEIARRYG